ncbi:response regulator [Longitalea luteola]|uniref:response regulator n=1 Tax=Longitalea luteola TaxID=2812563 RepID=UPI001A97A165|nr:response regulator [Longitalea luteola]
MKREIKHICLAEDDPDDHYLFLEVLTEIDRNIKLSWFQNCEELLQFLKTTSELPCLIVMDMNMPKMSGQNCLISIKKELNLYNIPVIIFSTASEPSIIDTAQKAGAYKYIVKPFSLTEFRNIVREILATTLP